MQLITDLSAIETPFTNSVITLGNFDGLHLGHQELVRMVIDRARQIGAVSVVVTFRPHPLKILAPERCPPLISIYEEKIRLLEGLGIDVLVKIPFTVSFSSLTPEEFVRDILCGLLGAKEIFVGYNYRFGKGRAGTTDILRELGKRHGFVVREVEQIAIGGEVVSSTKIRNLLKEGDVDHAARLLGRAYAITGIVVKGDSRGKELGFPTANIAPKHAIVPANGVYAVRLSVRDALYEGVANIGLRPTFGKDQPTIEVHVFDFNEDLYGEEISLFFMGRLREERKFSSAAELIRQIHTDIAEARRILLERPAGRSLSPMW